jgi:hypothetical protein
MRGEVMLDFDVFDGGEEELEKLNNGKIGEPYHYLYSFLNLLGLFLTQYFSRKLLQVKYVHLFLHRHCQPAASAVVLLVVGVGAARRSSCRSIEGCCGL